MDEAAFDLCRRFYAAVLASNRGTAVSPDDPYVCDVVARTLVAGLPALPSRREPTYQGSGLPGVKPRG